MNTNYEIMDIRVEKLYVNPDNARFINSDEIPNEFSAIKEIVKLKSDHVVNLAKDIATDGLNPNELPIVMYNPDIDCFLVMDGNRRITSIKLITQYIDKIDSIDFKSSQKRELKSIKCNIKTVRCIVCEDEEYVNYLLEKLHTSKPGINQSKWDPQAQDRHKEKVGAITRRLALIKMLDKSEYTSSKAKNILSEKGWLSKLQRFMPNKYIENFGIKFDKNSNIILFIEEAEVMKGLSKLVVDLKEIKADDIAQTEEVKTSYLNSLPLDKSKINSHLIIFDVGQGQFIRTDIPNNISLRKNNENDGHNKDSNSFTNDLKNSKIITTNNLTSFDGENSSNEKVKETESKNENKNENSKTQKVKNLSFYVPNFFEDLTWSKVDTRNADNIGVLRVAQEIVTISKNNNYKKFPISATFLTRSLFEQTLIYHLRSFSSSAYNILLKSNNNRTPALEKLINYFVKNSSNIFDNDKNLERTFLSFVDNAGTKHYLDMVIHNPHLVTANPDILDSIVNAGLKAYVQAILNR